MNDSGVLGKIVGGWEVSTLGIWHTGHPLAVTLGLGGTIDSGPFAGLPQTFLLPDGNDQTTQRPDRVPGVPLYLPGHGHNGSSLINPLRFKLLQSMRMEISFVLATPVTASPEL